MKHEISPVMLYIVAEQKRTQTQDCDAVTSDSQHLQNWGSLTCEGEVTDSTMCDPPAPV